MSVLVSCVTGDADEKGPMSVPLDQEEEMHVSVNNSDTRWDVGRRGKWFGTTRRPGEGCGEAVSPEGLK